jgi:hypothetical protein
VTVKAGLRYDNAYLSRHGGSIGTPE